SHAFLPLACLSSILYLSCPNIHILYCIPSHLGKDCFCQGDSYKKSQVFLIHLHALVAFYIHSSAYTSLICTPSVNISLTKLSSKYSSVSLYEYLVRSSATSSAVISMLSSPSLSKSPHTLLT